MKNIKWFIFIIVGVLLLTGCGKKSEENNNSGKISINDKYISLSSKDLTIKKGETGEVNITISKAVGLFNISSSNKNIANVDKESLWLEAIEEDTDTKTITVSGSEVGNTQIVITLADVASFDTEEELTGSYTINVKVE